MICKRTDCPWWDEDGCLSEECGAWEDGEWMNKPEEEVEQEEKG